MGRDVLEREAIGKLCHVEPGRASRCPSRTRFVQPFFIHRPAGPTRTGVSRARCDYCGAQASSIVGQPEAS